MKIKNMKNRLAVVLFCFIMVLSVVPIFASSDAGTNTGWKKGYVSFLKKLEPKDPTRTPHFILAYLNNDSIPELFVIHYADGYSGPYIYTYANGKVKEVFQGGHYGGIYYAKKKCMLKDSSVNFGCEYTGFSKFNKNLKLKKSIGFLSYNGEYSILENNRAKTVSEAVYKSKFKAYDKYKYKRIGYSDAVELNSKNIKKIITNTKSVTAS